MFSDDNIKPVSITEPPMFAIANTQKKPSEALPEDLPNLLPAEEEVQNKVWCEDLPPFDPKPVQDCLKKYRTRSLEVAFRRSAHDGDLKSLELLLDTKLVNISAVSPNRRLSALHIAVRYTRDPMIQKEVVEFLLQHGARPEQKNNFHENAIDYINKYVIDDAQKELLIAICKSEMPLSIEKRKIANENFNALERKLIIRAFNRMVVKLENKVESLSKKLMEFDQSCNQHPFVQVSIQPKKTYEKDDDCLELSIQSIKINDYTSRLQIKNIWEYLENLKKINAESLYFNYENSIYRIINQIEIANSLFNEMIKKEILTPEDLQNGISEILDGFERINKEFNQLRNVSLGFPQFKFSYDPPSIKTHCDIIVKKEKILPNQKPATIYDISCSMQFPTNVTKNNGRIAILATNSEKDGPKTLRVGMHFADKKILTLFKVYIREGKMLVTNIADIHKKPIRKSKKETEAIVETQPTIDIQALPKSNTVEASVKCVVFSSNGKKLSPIPVNNNEVDWSQDPDPTILWKFPRAYTRNCGFGDVWHQSIDTTICYHGTSPTK